MDTLLSLSSTLFGGRTASVATTARTAVATAPGGLAGDTVVFSEQALALARTLVAASNAAVASNAGMTATAAVASNAGAAAAGGSLGLGTHERNSVGASHGADSLKRMIKNIQAQITTVEHSAMSADEKKAKLFDLRSELARVQQEYQKAALNGVGGIPRSGTPAEGMGASLT